MVSIKLLVQGHGTAIKEPLNYYPNGSFNIKWEKNQTWQITLTAIDDGSIAYAMLGSEASLFWNDQEYIIKQCVTDYANGIGSKQITATHVYSEVQRVLQRIVKTGTLTYSVNDVLSFVLSGNSLGFTWQVIGNFDKEQITDFGNINGQDMLSKIVEVWPNAIIYPDNKNIRVYEHDSFVQDLGSRIDYRANSSEVKLTYDSTSIANQVMAIGAQKDDSSYYFDPFLVSDNNSIRKWGLHPGTDVSDDRFHDKASMEVYAKSQLIPEPALTLDVTEDTGEIPIAGEIRRVEIRNYDFVTKTEVVGFTYYPLDKGVNTSITLNNTAKTILDYQNNLAKQFQKSLTNEKRNLSASMKQLQADIAELQKNAAGNWTAGTIFMDISSNQDFDASDFAKLYSQGIKGAIVKLTEGTNYTNPSFANQKEYTINAKMKFIGTYHYLKSTSTDEATEEAQYYVKQLQANNIDKDLIVACDVEDSTLSMDATELTAEVKAFMKVLTDAGYNNTTDYTSVSWLGSRFVGQGRYKWIASWDVSSVPDNADAWQYSSTFNGQSLDVNRSYNKIFI